MHVACPTCGEAFPIGAGFHDTDGKRFGMLLAGMEPTLGRAVIEYLPLFNPAKQKLRLSKAVKLVEALDALVREGSVCRDERSSVRLPVTVAQWVTGIEQTLAQRARLTLPLQNHHYLRTIVYGIADQAAAAKERQTEADKRAGRHLEPAQAGAQRSTRVALNDALRAIESDVRLGILTPEKAEERKAETLAEFGVGRGGD
ncbi:hypothetical protein [Frateuria sp. YIM B11624]|uniref:hypothetical protein n=1 Tax=Frateuria sp. YIM B11624 TaxID=3143185 RepID=UPI003C730607